MAPGRYRSKQKPAAEKGFASSTRPTIPWQQTAGMYLAGQEWVDEVDLVTLEMDRKWGRGRLRLMVGPDIREKYDRQRYLYLQALWEGQLEDLRREAGMMVKALRRCDELASIAGKRPIHPSVWEVTLDDGRVAAIVREPEALQFVAADGRYVVVYDLEEIGKLLPYLSDVCAIKEAFPGATVAKAAGIVKDPFAAMEGIDTHGIFDVRAPIDDVMNFEDDSVPF